MPAVEGVMCSQNNPTKDAAFMKPGISAAFAPGMFVLDS